MISKGRKISFENRMNKKLSFLILGSIVAIVVLGIFVGFNQSLAAPANIVTPQSVVPGTPPITGGEGVIDLLNQVLVWVATAFWIAAAGFLFYAGFLYLTAAGSEDIFTKAKNMTIYAIIAIVVGLMAYGMPTFIENILYKR